MPTEYKIETLLDIAKLEDDQIDRLCSELPRALKYAKAMMGLIQAASGEVIPIVQMLSPLTWTDDGKNEITSTAICEGERLLQMVVEATAQARSRESE